MPGRGVGDNRIDPIPACSSGSAPEREALDEPDGLGLRISRGSVRGRPDAELGASVVERPRPERALPRIFAQASGTSQSAASGGIVISAEYGCPCQGTGSATIPPKFPWSLPP